MPIWSWKIVMIGLLGAAGSLLRFGLSTGVHRLAGEAFPYGTLVVNFLGCFAIGALYQASQTAAWTTPDWRVVISVGLLGGFTTFSAFGLETFILWESGQLSRAVANVLANLLIGLAAVYLGARLAA